MTWTFPNKPTYYYTESPNCSYVMKVSPVSTDSCRWWRIPPRSNDFNTNSKDGLWSMSTERTYAITAWMNQAAILTQEISELAAKRLLLMWGYENGN